MEEIQWELVENPKNAKHVTIRITHKMRLIDLANLLNLVEP